MLAVMLAIHHPFTKRKNLSCGRKNPILHKLLRGGEGVEISCEFVYVYITNRPQKNSSLKGPWLPPCDRLPYHMAALP
jgi:hypothetical protein